MLFIFYRKRLPYIYILIFKQVQFLLVLGKKKKKKPNWSSPHESAASLWPHSKNPNNHLFGLFFVMILLKKKKNHLRQNWGKAAFSVNLLPFSKSVLIFSANFNLTLQLVQTTGDWLNPSSETGRFFNKKIETTRLWLKIKHFVDSVKTAKADNKDWLEINTEKKKLFLSDFFHCLHLT